MRAFASRGDARAIAALVLGFVRPARPAWRGTTPAR
jgi:hypothetical protein